MKFAGDQRAFTATLHPLRLLMRRLRRSKTTERRTINFQSTFRWVLTLNSMKTHKESIRTIRCTRTNTTAAKCIINRARTESWDSKTREKLLSMEVRRVSKMTRSLARTTMKVIIIIRLHRTTTVVICKLEQTTICKSMMTQPNQENLPKMNKPNILSTKGKALVFT